MEVYSSSSTHTYYNQTTSTNENSKSMDNLTNSKEKNDNHLFDMHILRNNDEIRTYVENVKKSKSEGTEYIADQSYLNLVQRMKEYKEELENDYNEKISNPNLIDGVTYDPKTKEYSYIADNYGVKTREPHRNITIRDNSVKITTDEPITKEYLEERYEKIQHFFETEYESFRHKVLSGGKEFLDEIGVGMSGFTQRDASGIVKIDDKYIEIDGDEYQKHLAIYREKKYIEYSGDQDYEDVNTNLSIQQFHGNTKLFDNAKELKEFIDTLESASDVEVYRQVSLAINLGLIKEGDQMLYKNLLNKDKATNAFDYIDNSILKKATLDTVKDHYTSCLENIMYEHIFNENFQKDLDAFAQELKENPDKYSSTHSDFTFSGDITIDENSSKEYKNFITNTLIDFVDNKMNNYLEERNLSLNEEGITDNEKGFTIENLGLELYNIYAFKYTIESLEKTIIE